jgi:hypothetical protein
MYLFTYDVQRDVQLYEFRNLSHPVMLNVLSISFTIIIMLAERRVIIIISIYVHSAASYANSTGPLFRLRE